MDEETRLGPHLLGRIYKPDERDWSPEKLHLELQPPESLLNMTVGEAIAESSFFQSWTGWLALWKWVKGHLHPKPAPTPSETPAWVDTIVLDQGNYGTCVGNGWAGWGNSTPVVDNFDETVARAIYYESTIIGGSPDNPDAPGGGQQGSTVRDGAKAMQKRALLINYAFAATLTDVDEWLNNHGPVVFGTDWTNDMFEPDAAGYVKPTGGVAGGHCFLCLDKIDAEDAYLFRNSWGKSWGQSGNFKMKRADVALLLKGLESPGEACLSAEVAH
jgi:hypothetical protein